MSTIAEKSEVRHYIVSAGQSSEIGTFVVCACTANRWGDGPRIAGADYPAHLAQVVEAPAVRATESPALALEYIANLMNGHDLSPTAVAAYVRDWAAAEERDAEDPHAEAFAAQSVVRVRVEWVEEIRKEAVFPVSEEVRAALAEPGLELEVLEDSLADVEDHALTEYAVLDRRVTGVVIL